MSFADSTPALIFFGGVATLWATVIVFRMRHRREMETFAAENDLEFLGSGVPRDLPPKLTDALSYSLRVRNCISGMRRGERVVCFEFARLLGNYRAWYWAVAVKRAHPEQPLPQIRNYAIGRAGDWVLLCHDGIFLSHRAHPRDVLVMWDRLQTAEVRAAIRDPSTNGDNVLIRPRHEL